MPQLILPSRFTQQPQQPAPLDCGNPMVARPHVLINAAIDVNVASGVPLRRGGAGYAKTPLGKGLTNQFRKNFFLASEALPALGTQSFIEFWYGYPSADQGNQGSGANDPTFLTGSGSNNSALVSRLGPGAINDGYPESWGVLYRWSDIFYAAQDTLTPGMLVLLMVVRRQDRIELWRDGILRRTIFVAPQNLASSSFTVGSFVESPFWTSSSNMLAAGRFLGEWSVAQIKSFSENPWQVFKAPARRLWVSTVAQSDVTATPAGVTATASVGTAVARGAASASPSGVGAVASVGTATASGSTVASPAGVTATASVGTATASGAALSVPAGVSASSSIGIATATGAARAAPAGVAATASVGAATATTQDGALIASLRQVATGTHIMNTLAASNTTTYSRTPHVLMSAVSSLAIVLPNWYVGGQTESNAGSATWTASIEYPAGTFQQVTFSGAASVTAATGGNIVSDQMPVMIPKGVKFWVRLFQNAPSRAVYFNYYAGDGTAQFVSPSADLTMGGTATTSAAFQAAITAPIAIIGMSSDPAIGIYGDSISVGRGDTADSGVPLQGHLGRAFGAVYAAGHVGISGDRISTFLAGNSRRMSLAQYFTHFAINMGINDVTNGDSAATIASNTNAMVALFPPNSVALCTLSPVSSSTNGWSTTANQTTGSSNGNRVTENARRLAGITGVKVLYDVNPAVESVASPESGIWKAPSYTADGTHPAVAGYKAEAASINPALLTADTPAAPLGVTAIASVGTATASGAARALPAGVTASASTGTATATGNATAAPAGVAATASITAPSARGAASASPSGITATASVGQASATAGGAGAAMPAGVGAAASVGAAAARGAANVLANGLTAYASVGVATASAGAGAIALPGGVTASTSVGQVAATGGAVALPAGVGAVASVGQAVASGSIVIPATAMPLGVTAYARVGTATASGGVLYARAPAGSGFTPQRQESQDRPANTQRNYR